MTKLKFFALTLFSIFLLSISVSALGTNLDFDGDGKADISLYNRSVGFVWTVRSSMSGIIYKQRFGNSEDIPVPGDYDGNGKTEYAVFRSGIWYVSTTTFPQVPNFYSAPRWGLDGDIPAPADYDGDGKTDLAVYRPSNGTWYIAKSSGGFIFQQWGISTDQPVPADYDFDGKTDICVIRRASGAINWYSLDSSNGAFRYKSFGLDTDRAVPFFNGQFHQYAAIRPSTGYLYVANFGNEGFAGRIPHNFGLANFPEYGLAAYKGQGFDDFANFGFNSDYNGNYRIIVSPTDTLAGVMDVIIGTPNDKLLSAIYVK